jgi:GH15 family glucan-1,4-alpha-glucosidase
VTDLAARSIQIILEAQAASGAYPACPEFPTYQYSWFRDGSFIAHAMDLVGQHESARRFHNWAATTIAKRAELVEQAVAKARSGRRLEQRELLHTRYALDGDLADDADWPNFQLDGFGTWLWAVGQHMSRTGSNWNSSLQTASQLTADYLKALWRLPCYDCWEEFPDQVHPYTLAAIDAGLRAHQDLASRDHEEELVGIRKRLTEESVVEGAFVKSIGRSDVDASLVGLSTPYDVVEPDDSRMQRTVARVEHELIGQGGVHRYSKDTYYGGGEWVLLTAWLAWHYRRLSRRDHANQLLEWVEQQADEQGQLPEQVATSLIDPSYHPIWVERWGPVAKPLLWSHAMYLIARSA